MIETVFSTLDIAPDESRVWLALLEHGPLEAGALARRMGVKRPSLYGFLRRLVEKGVVTESRRASGVKMFSAERPEAVMRIFRDRLEGLEMARARFESLIPALDVKSGPGLSGPRFEIFEGREGVQNVLRDMLLYSGIETCSFWPIRAMVDILSPEFFHHHNRVRIKNRVSVKALWPRDQVVDIAAHPYLGAGKDYLREIRVAPEGVAFTMGYWVYKSRTAFLSSARESFGFIIESAELAAMMTAQHNIIWGLSKPLPIRPDDMEPFLRELRRDARDL